MPLHTILFATALTLASRIIHLRDFLLGRIPRARPQCPQVSATQHTIPSGKNLLDAVYTEPSAEPVRAAVLICHGIGEVVPQWFPIQRIFAENGIASIVFDYSGYGRSTGFPHWSQCEQDAVSTFQLLQRLAPAVPISILGFSLGTGVAPAILDRVTPDRLVLCGGFPSFRRAARATGIPGFLSACVPPIWSAEEALRNCVLPVLVVQGDRDRLFGIEVGRELLSGCGPDACFLVLPARSHNEPFYKPQMHYWGPIISWILQRESEPTAPSA